MKIICNTVRKNKKRSQYQIIIKGGNKTESYRVDENLFNEIKNMIIPYRSIASSSKPIRCIETNKIFKNANAVKSWLIKMGITESYSSDAAIKSVCKGHRKTAYGYHWEFV